MNRSVRRAINQDLVVYDIELRQMSFIKRVILALKIILQVPVDLKLSEEGMKFTAGGQECDGIRL